MALSKAIKAALDAWKEGKGEFPEALDAGVHFENDGAFMSAVDSKAKKREQAAREAATAELLEKLGITDAAEIEQIKAKLDASGAAGTEVEALKKLNGKLAKDNETSKAAIAKYISKIQGIARRDALMPFASQVRDVEALSLFVGPQLEVDDDGNVTGKDGKTVEQLVEQTLKAKDYLRNPDFKDGAGTKPTSKIKLPFAPPAKDDKDAKPLTIGQVFVNELAAKGVLTNPMEGGP